MKAPSGLIRLLALGECLLLVATSLLLIPLCGAGLIVLLHGLHWWDGLEAVTAVLELLGSIGALRCLLGTLRRKAVDEADLRLTIWLLSGGGVLSILGYLYLSYFVPEMDLEAAGYDFIFVIGLLLVIPLAHVVVLRRVPTLNRPGKD